MPNNQPSESPYSVKLFTAFGIPVRAHFTFVIFLVWIAFISRPNAAVGVLLTLALFACVLLHELGHALVAKRYGVGTRDIVLSPIGGLATLKTRPKPNAEFWIALAGPSVNLIIFFLLLPLALLTPRPLPSASFDKSSVLWIIVEANIALALFNLLPAFPMDGGRVLRALLSMWMPEERATRISASIGQFIAFLMLLIGLYFSEPIIMLIAIFVMLGAGQEVSITRTRSVLAGHTVADAMQSKFTSIESGASMDAAAKMLLDGSEHDFPVVAGSEVIGVLTRTDIARGLAAQGASGYVAGAMQREFQRVASDLPLEDAVELFGERSGGPLLVMDDETLLGLLTREGLSEFMMLEHAKMRSRQPAGRR